MKKALLSAVLFLFVTIHQSVAQKQIPFVDPGKVIKEALVLRDSQRYDDAAKKLLQIDKSDTSYVYMLTELASTYLSAEKFKEAIETTTKALNSRSIYQLRLLLIRGNAFDHAGLPDSSIADYQDAMKKYPYKYHVYYKL
jgi:tetratricopeptide (TPR) repeat protein